MLDLSDIQVGDVLEIRGFASARSEGFKATVSRITKTMLVVPSSLPSKERRFRKSTGDEIVQRKYGLGNSSRKFVYRVVSRVGDDV